MVGFVRVLIGVICVLIGVVCVSIGVVLSSLSLNTPHTHIDQTYIYFRLQGDRNLSALK